MTQRIEGALMFTMVRFLYALLRKGFGKNTIAFLNVLVAFMAYNLKRLVLMGRGDISALKSLRYISRVFQKFATLISTQAIIQSLQPVDLGTSSVLVQVECLAVSLCMLILLTLLPVAFKHSEDGMQFMRLVLFMFTDNTEFIIHRVAFGWTLPFLSMAGFIFMYRLKHERSSEIHMVLSQAFTLALTNMMILSTWTVNVHSTDSYSQLTQLISLLVLFDAISHVFGQFSAMRDYAVWQGAAQVYNMVVLQKINETAVIVVAGFVILILQVSSKYFMSSGAITELSVLLILNIILGMIRRVITTLHANDTMIVVMLWIMVIEIFTSALKSFMRG